MEPETPTPSASAKFAGAVLLLALALIGATAYSLHQRSAVQRLAAQNEQVTAALQDTHTQIEALKAQVAAATAPPPAPMVNPAAARPKPARHVAARRAPADPRWQKVQAQLEQQKKQLDEHGKQIESTRQDLASARTALQTSIASTHDELVALQKKGERNYYEFDLDKSKQFQREGPVGIRLRKADTKHQFADLELMVDDVDLTKKHVNRLEPVVFYSAEGGRPVELVINGVSKNHIHGYVSEPKYKAADLAPAKPAADTQPAAAAATVSTTPPSAARRRLELPK